MEGSSDMNNGSSDGAGAGKTSQTEGQAILNLEFSPIPSPSSQTSCVETEQLTAIENKDVVNENICLGEPDAPIKNDLVETGSVNTDSIGSTSQANNEEQSSDHIKVTDIVIIDNLKQGEVNETNSPTLKHKNSEKSEKRTDEEDIKDEVITDSKNPTSCKGGNSKIYCSTPVLNKTATERLNPSVKPSTSNDFGLMSPLDVSCVAGSKGLKRKNLGLDCIKEVDEDAPDVIHEKKVKTEDANQQDPSSSLPCFEPPAKSILKKWQPSCLTRNSFVVLDECGEIDVEEGSKPNQELSETTTADDFEVACKSLTEELMKSSTNLGTLEKYQSQVQLESQIDDEKFDEVLQELNFELGEKTLLSIRTMEESDLILAESDLKNTTNKVTPESEKLAKDSSLNSSMSESNVTVIEVKSPQKANLNNESNSNNPKLSQETHETTKTSESGLKITVKVKEDCKREIAEVASKEQISPPEELSIVYADGKDMTMDEEDFLLEEDISSKKKPYEFFEFVSSDPKENEDNYNPEWQKLGRLTSDEERYKAVRDRWRSLVPPDPNRDLTCRQWREKNQKPPLNLPSRNNNHQMHFDDERNQLCTAVFEMKIQKIVQELEEVRKDILIRRNMAFEDLALSQDQEQRRLALTGGSRMDMAVLHKHHIEECRKLKDEHDLELNKITLITDEKMRILKEARDEVLLFQKFYKGVGSRDDKGCLYMTDTQVQELMETEEMLEQYSKFYR